MSKADNAKTAREKAAELRVEAAKTEARRRNRNIVIAVVALAVMLVGTGILMINAKKNAEARVAAANQPPGNLVNDGMPTGVSTAAVTVNVWEDFMCPHCKRAEQENRAQIQAWVSAGKVRVIYHPLGLLDQASTTNYSTRAANAAAVVNTVKPQAYLAFQEALFAAQPAEGGPGLTDDQLIEIATSVGVDKAAIEPDIRKLRYKSWVEEANNLFSQNGFTGTPTYVVNNVPVTDAASGQGTYAPEAIKAAVEAAAK